MIFGYLDFGRKEAEEWKEKEGRKEAALESKN